MTYVWIALIVVGAVMIAFALWPTIRGRSKRGPAAPASADDGQEVGGQERVDLAADDGER